MVIFVTVLVREIRQAIDKSFMPLHGILQRTCRQGDPTITSALTDTFNEGRKCHYSRISETTQGSNVIC
jgi:hypothetical protein